MSPALKRNLGFLFAMLLTAGAAFGLTPRHKIAEHNPMPKLEELIPPQFGQWRQIPSGNQIVDPGQQQKLNMIYDQILSRTFENEQGYRIMLSLAYGGNQRDELELHKPEVCYVAQGFVLGAKNTSILNIMNRQIPAVQLHMSMNNRIEPVTYWAVVGDTIVHSSYHKKLIELRYGLKGQIPDGVLVRVSSIDPNSTQAFAQQTDFLQQLMQSVNSIAQSKLLGKP